MGSIRRAIIVISEPNLLSSLQTRQLSPPSSGGLAAGSAPFWFTEKVGSAISADAAEVVLAIPEGEEEFQDEPVFQNLARIRYSGRSVTGRIDNLMAKAWKLRYQPCVLTTGGGDISSESFRASFDLLRAGQDCYDLVAEGSETGDLNLIGFKWPQPSLLSKIQWRKTDILSQLKLEALELDLRLHVFPRPYANSPP